MYRTSESEEMYERMDFDIDNKLRLMEISHTRYTGDREVPRDSTPGLIRLADFLINGDWIGAMAYRRLCTYWFSSMRNRQFVSLVLFSKMQQWILESLVCILGVMFIL
jgi:hypothetical protein